MDSEDWKRTNGETSETRRLILNPVSGGGGHAEQAHQLTQSYGFSVIETNHTGHGVELAKQAAADGIDLLAVCGGDGTIHEAVQGLVAAEALKSVSLCVVPAGTVNILADGLGSAACDTDSDWPRAAKRDDSISGSPTTNRS